MRKVIGDRLEVGAGFISLGGGAAGGPTGDYDEGDYLGAAERLTKSTFRAHEAFSGGASMIRTVCQTSLLQDNFR